MCCFLQKIALDDIEAHSGYQFIAIGHDLGGVVATIFLYEAINKGYLDQNKNEPVLFTFEQPRTGNFVLDFNKKIKNLMRIVWDGDIVVSLP